MRLIKLTIALIAIAGVTVNAAHLAAATEPKPPVAYFLDHTSTDADVPINLPADAKDVVVAKVGFLMSATWLGGRHCEGCTNDILFTRVKIVGIKRGRAEIGQVFDVRMGLRNDYREFAYPHTPDQLGRKYTVVIYSSDDGLRRLASFPISTSEYSQWNEEVWAYERERGKSGHHDR
jgi:hypothetical protein